MNVRWDAAAKSGLLEGSLFEAPVGDGRAGAPCRCSDRETLKVEIWLFGPLARRAQRGPVVLEIAIPCRVRDVLDQLETRIGSSVLRHVVGRKGEARETCRVSVNGMLVRDLMATIPADRSTATVELIAFEEIEGG